MMMRLAIQDNEAEIVASMRPQHSADNDVNGFRRRSCGRRCHSTAMSIGCSLIAAIVARQVDVGANAVALVGVNRTSCVLIALMIHVDRYPRIAKPSLSIAAVTIDV